MRVLKDVIAGLQERVIPSALASERKEFMRLGLADASTIEAASEEVVVLSTDLDLCLAVQAKGQKAINFNHVREIYLSPSELSTNSSLKRDGDPASLIAGDPAFHAICTE